MGKLGGVLLLLLRLVPCQTQVRVEHSESHLFYSFPTFQLHSFHFFPFLYDSVFFLQDTAITGVLAGMADLSVLSLSQWIPRINSKF